MSRSEQASIGWAGCKRASANKSHLIKEQENSSKREWMASQMGIGNRWTAEVSEEAIIPGRNIYVSRVTDGQLPLSIHYFGHHRILPYPGTCVHHSHLLHKVYLQEDRFPQHHEAHSEALL